MVLTTTPITSTRTAGHRHRRPGVAMLLVSLSNRLGIYDPHCFLERHRVILVKEEWYRWGGLSVSFSVIDIFILRSLVLGQASSDVALVSIDTLLPIPFLQF